MHMDREKQLHPPPLPPSDERDRKHVRSKRASYAIRGCTVLVLLLVIIALVVLPQVFGSSGNGHNNNDTPLSPSPAGPKGDVNTTIVRDARLHQSFYGIDYTPHGSQYHDGCGVAFQDVVEDVKVLSQLTTRVRLYGMDCNQASLVVQAIKLLKLEMGVMLTLWVDGNATTYERQYQTFMRFLHDHGADHVVGVSVGNEAVFRKQITAPELVGLIQGLKQQLHSMGLDAIPVVTTEINDLKHLIPYEDAVLDNVHPFFAGTRPQDAAAWTWRYFYDVDQYPTLADPVTGHLRDTQTKPAIISEIGWPTEPASHRVKAAVPSIANQQTLLDTFVCEANRRNLPYYWFEFKDQPWKAALFNETREAYWGLFDKDRNLKPARIPACHDANHPWQKGNFSVPQPAPLRD